MQTEIRTVLHVLNGAIGGAAESTTALVHGLAERNIASVIYVTNRAPAEAVAKLGNVAGVEVHTGPQFIWTKRQRLRYPIRFAAFLHQMITTRGVGGAVGQIIDVAKASNVDLIHSSTVVSPDGAIAARALGLPHVWHVRELVGVGQPHRLRGDNSGTAARRLVRSGRVICNSQTTKTTIFGSNEVSGVCVVPNGLDLSSLSALPLSKFDDPLIFGMVANLSARWKEHMVFVAAARCVARELPDAQFRIFGEIPRDSSGRIVDEYARSVMNATLSADLHGRFTLEGFVPTFDAIGAVDILVHPARGESFGRIYAEAMASGRPVIAPMGTVAEEILGAGEGFLCDAGDPDAFAEAMLACSREVRAGKLDRSLLRLRERALNRFGQDAYVDGVVEAYENAKAPKQTGKWRSVLSVIFG